MQMGWQLVVLPVEQLASLETILFSIRRVLSPKRIRLLSKNTTAV